MIDWITIQKHTSRFRVPLVIWLRKNGLLDPIHRAITKQRIQRAKNEFEPVTIPDSSHVLIVCANFNHAKWLSGCIDSVKHQTFKRWTLVIVDDRSTDESASVICEAARKSNQIIGLQLEENQGAYIARNTAIEACNGQVNWTHLTFIDPDDVAQPSWLEHVMQTIGHSPEGWVRPLLRRVSNDLSITTSRYHGYCQTLYTRNSWQRIGGFENVRISGDVDAIERSKRIAKLLQKENLERFAFEDSQLCRVHSSNASQTHLHKRKKWLEKRLQSFQKTQSPKDLRIQPKTAKWHRIT